MHRTLFVLLLGALTPISGFAQTGDAPWSIPTPETIEVPGGGPEAASPRSYPDPDGFTDRAAAIRRGLLQQDLGAYRRGYFSGGDPGKYVPGYAMARLIENPDDETARTYMNDDRSFKEHYHFAAVNWARFLPLFGEGALTGETREKIAQKAFTYGSYLNPSGTENHRTMSMTSASVLPWYTDKGLSHQSRETALQKGKDMLKEYVKGLYMAGQGEWDSSTYLMFDINGLLNIYDFAKDDEARLLARAGLDWLVAAYALKYTDGVYTAPNQRGFAGAPADTIADQTGYLWWGSDYQPTQDEFQQFRYTLHAQTSGWRPNRILTHIARKNLSGLPAEQRNSKPNYWYGQQIPWKAGAYPETVYLTPFYTLAGLWSGHGSQITRWMLTADTGEGGRVFHGGHPRRSDHTGKKIGIGTKDGIGRYDQTAVVGPVLINLSRAPAEEPFAYSFFAYPNGIEPLPAGGWWVMEADGTYVGVHGVGGEMIEGETELTKDQIEANRKREEEGRDPRHHTQPVLRVNGYRTGYIVQTADRHQFETLPNFTDWLLEARIEDTDFVDSMEVTYTPPQGKTIRMKFNPDPDGDRHANRRPEVSVNGEEITFADWPIYGGPFVTQTPGLLKVTDGEDGYQIDFTGDLPVYSPWNPTP